MASDSGHVVEKLGAAYHMFEYEVPLDVLFIHRFNDQELVLGGGAHLVVHDPANFYVEGIRVKIWVRLRPAAQ